MSESRLGVSITARDVNATASIGQLRTTVKGLEQTLRDIGGTALDAGGKITAALNTEIAAINREIAARGAQSNAIKAVTSAIKEQTTAAGVLHRTLQQSIDASFGSGSDRAIKSAAESARVLATSLSAAAESDARLRDTSAATAKAVNDEAIALARQAKAAEQAAAYNMLLGRTNIALAESGAVGAGVSRVSGGSSGNATLSREARHAVAAFDELARGQRGALFSTMGAAARDAGLGVGALAISVGGLIAIMAGGAILHGAETMGKWATETRAAASAAGMSLGAYSSLQGALGLIGLKGNEADTTLRHLAESLSKALADPATLAAEAFNNLGISQTQLVSTGGDVGKLLPMLADAFARTADSANKSANMEELAGRGFERLIPALQNGREGFQALIDKAKELGIHLEQDAAEKLETTTKSINTLTGAIHGQAIKAFVAWSTEIQSFVGVLGKAVEGIGSVIGAIGKFEAAKINAVKGAWDWLNTTQPKDYPTTGPLMSRPGELTASNTSAFTHFATPQKAGGGVAVPPLMPVITSAERTAHDVALASRNAAYGAGDSRSAHMAETQAEIGEIQKRVNAAKEGSKEKLVAETELYNKQRELRNEQLSGSGAAAKQSVMDFIAAEKLKIAEAQGNSAKIQAIYNEMLDGLRNNYKATAAQIATIEREKVQAINTARLQEIKEGTKQEEEQSRLFRLNSTLSSMAAGTFAYQGQSKNQSPSADIGRSKQFIGEAEQVRSMASQQIAALTEVRNAAAQGSNLQKTAAQEILSVEMNSKAAEIALYEKAGAAAVEAANKMLAPFKSLFDNIGSQFESFSSSVISSIISPQVTMLKAGLTTIKTSMQGNEIRSAARTLFLNIAGDIGKTIETALGHAVAGALSGGTANSIGDLLGNLFSKIISSTFGSTAGSALGNVAGSAAGSVGSSSAIIGAITTAATAETTGITTSLATLGATLTSAIIASTTSIVGAITGSSAVEDSLLVGLNAKPSVLGFTYSQGGIVPSAAGGMIVGGTDASLAILHAKEMVLPAPISQGIQQMIAKGGQDGNSNSANLNYSPTINTGSRGRGGTGMSRSEFQQMMSLHSGSMLGAARNMIRGGWRPA